MDTLFVSSILMHQHKKYSPTISQITSGIPCVNTWVIDSGIRIHDMRSTTARWAMYRFGTVFSFLSRHITTRDSVFPITPMKQIVICMRNMIRAFSDVSWSSVSWSSGLSSSCPKIRQPSGSLGRMCEVVLWDVAFSIFDPLCLCDIQVEHTSK